MVCQFLLYNKVNQLYIYICSHISSLLHLPATLPIPPLQVVKKHRADLPVLRGCFPLAIYFTFGSVYMSMPLSHFVTSYPSPSPYLQVHSLVGLCLYSRLFNLVLSKGSLGSQREMHSRDLYAQRQGGVNRRGVFLRFRALGGSCLVSLRDWKGRGRG